MTAPTERSLLSGFLLPAERYNSLPYVNTAHDAANSPEGLTAKITLLKLISDNGLNDVFSLHLLHKHFDVPATQVMVYETVRGPKHPVYQVLAPQYPEMVSPLQAAYFFATLDGGMQAYEYTTDAQPDISQYDSFVSTFAQAVSKLGMQEVFALGVRPYFSLTNCTEIELHEYGSTVFVENFELPDSFQTDWTNPVRALDNVDCYLHTAKTRGPGEKKCTRRRKPQTHGRLDFSSRTKTLRVDGIMIPRDCQAHLVLSSAIKRLAYRG